MNYNDLSGEAKEVLKGMVQYCINNGLCMGMDEGIKHFDDDASNNVLHPFRAQLEQFVKANQE